MKLVKLNKNHILFRNDACVYAWQFDNYNDQARRLVNFMENKYGDRYGKGMRHWAATFGSPKLQMMQGMVMSYKARHKIYWVGIKDAKELPFLLLQINDLA